VIEELQHPPELVPLDLDVSFRTGLLEDKKASIIHEVNEVTAGDSKLADPGPSIFQRGHSNSHREKRRPIELYFRPGPQNWNFFIAEWFTIVKKI
jgi:hypothetical protein